MINLDITKLTDQFRYHKTTTKKESRSKSDCTMPMLPKVHLSILSVTINPNCARLGILPPSCNFGKHMEKLRVKYGEFIAP